MALNGLKNSDARFMASRLIRSSSCISQMTSYVRDQRIVRFVGHRGSGDQAWQSIGRLDQ